MARTDLHPGVTTVDLAQAAEAGSIIKMSHFTNEIEKTTHKIEQIQRFLTALDMRTTDSQRADFSNEPEMKDLIDEVIQICDLPVGVYAWQGNQIKELNNSLNRRISQFQNEITLNTTHLTQIQYDTNKCFEILATMLKDCKDLIKRINENINRTR